MSREEIHRLWDDCRDGTLRGEERKRFDEQMLDDREMASLWGAESRWLSQLSSSPTKAESREGPTFTQTVVNQWEVQRRRSMAFRLRLTSGLFAGGCAALILIVAGVMWSRNSQQTTSPLQDRHLAARGMFSQPPPSLDPISVLVEDVTKQYHAAPAAVYRAAESSGQIFSLEGARDLLKKQIQSTEYPRPDFYYDFEEAHNPPMLLRSTERRERP